MLQVSIIYGRVEWTRERKNLCSKWGWSSGAFGSHSSAQPLSHE